jgi:hypothetical protein
VKNQQRPDGGGVTLRVEETEDGRWTWYYSEPAADMTLQSNETFASREIAMDWARRAYPDVPFADDQGE